MRISATELLLGTALDLALGDPPRAPHPIRGFGHLVPHLERFWRGTRLPLRIAGTLFWLSAVGTACLIVHASLRVLPRRWTSVYWTYSLLALRDLDVESSLVTHHLEQGDLAAARRAVSRIVGRDTEHLDEAEILRATVETVAENLSDGVIAPLFFLALFGPVGMAAYKAVNTLDSMVGYRNDRYRDFGWASARLDDLANLIPARLTAALIWLCAAPLGLNAPRSLSVTLRDARSQPSPNAGWPEAAVAGALGVRLGGLNHYRGVPSRKAYLGDPVRSLDRRAFRHTRRLLYACSGLFLAVLCAALPKGASQ